MLNNIKKIFSRAHEAVSEYSDSDVVGIALPKLYLYQCKTTEEWIGELIGNGRLLKMVRSESQTVVQGAFADIDCIHLEEKAPIPRQYVLMRTDINSMCLGRTVAQGIHAGNQMVYDITSVTTHPYTLSLEKWEREAKGFGTCIVLGVDKSQMEKIVYRAKEAGFHAGFVKDEEYPVDDGGEFYKVPVTTCAYVFGYDSDIRPITQKYGIGLLRAKDKQ